MTLICSQEVPLAGRLKHRGMKSPKVTTNRTVDTSSLDSIVADVIRPGMTDEQKALALLAFFHRTVYHYGWPYTRPEKEENWQDPVKVINVHGYSLCGSQARVFGRLCARVFGDRNTRLMGFNEREPGLWHMEHSPGAFLDSRLLRGFRATRRMGHSCFELRYGGRWRLIDPHVNFYAYHRDGRGIASAEEIIADPTLVTRPARRVRGLMPCGDQGPVFYASTYTNWGPITREVAPDDHVMDITLRRGDAYTRYWDRRGPFRWFSEMDRRWDSDYLADGPRHICEGDNPWRHYGNGSLLYRPRLKDASYRDGVSLEHGLAPPGRSGLHPAGARRRASVSFWVRLPYMAVASKLKWTGVRETGSDQLRIWIKDREDRWHQVWQEPHTGLLRRELDLSPWAAGAYQYEVRFDLAAARNPSHVALRDFSLETTFLLNYLALPRLLPGRNRVQVSVADPKELKDERLAVTYAWSDREGEHEDTRIVSSSPYSYQLDVAPVTTTPPENPKYMRFLRMTVS